MSFFKYKFMIKQEKKIKQKIFRLRAKKLFLTYPQLNSSTEFLKESVLKQLEKKNKTY